MGLFDSIKGEAQRNFVARPPDQGNTIVFKWPDHNIRLMTQLTVGGDEVALFVKNRNVAGVLPPKDGVYSLETHNIPFLSKLLEGVTGGNLFIAELFFVLTREVPNQRFGCPVGLMQDPQLKIAVTPLVHGEFSVRVTDPQKLVVNLAGLASGGQDDVFLHWFTEQLKKVMREELASLVVKKRCSLFEVSAHASEIETAVLARVQAEISGYGVQITRLGSVEVSFSDADSAKLQQRTEMESYADLGQNPGLQGYAQAKMMMGAGEGMSKGGEGAGNAMAGMGMGMGFGMANMYTQQQQQTQHQRGAPPPQQGQAPGGNLVACGKCGQQVPPGKFCAGCGAPLAVAGPRHCTECGNELAAGAKFCGNCGKPQA